MELHALDIVRVDVTQDDIDKGDPVSSVSCAVARALARQICEEKCHIQVTENTAHIATGPSNCVCENVAILPQEMIKFVKELERAHRFARKFGEKPGVKFPLPGPASFDLKFHSTRQKAMLAVD